MTFVVEESSLLDSRDLWYELNLLKKLQAEPHPNVVLGCLTKDIFQCEGREFSMLAYFIVNIKSCERYIFILSL